MSSQEILAEIQKLPLEERRRLLKSLAAETPQEAPPEGVSSEDEVGRILLAEGVITNIPPRQPDDEEETYEPIEVPGTPLSETIIEERR